MSVPTRKTAYWVGAAALLYLIAWNVGSGWLYVIIAVLIAFPLGSLVLGRRNTGGVDAALSSPDRCRQGDPVTASLRITNHSRLPRLLLSFACDMGGVKASVFIDALKPRQISTIPFTFASMRRGVYPSAGITLTSRAPLGLTRSRRRFTSRQELVVYPGWTHLASDWGHGQQSAGDILAGAVATRNPTSDYLGVREYRTADSPRSIHWRTTARRNSLAVVEHARHEAVLPVFILDPYRDADIGPEGESSFELCVKAAASLVQREASCNRSFSIGASPGEAAARGLSHDPEAAMLLLAGITADVPRPVSLRQGELPWPEATPVLLLTSHRDYARLDEAPLLASHPHTIVVMVDGRGFAAGGADEQDLMDDAGIDALAGRLEPAGASLVLIGDPGEMAACLEEL